MTPEMTYLVPLIGGSLFVLVLIALVWPENGGTDFKKRLDRVTLHEKPLAEESVAASRRSLRRSTLDSNIPLIDKLIKAFLPNPEKMRALLARTGREIPLGIYLMLNGLSVGLIFLAVSSSLKLATTTSVLIAVAGGLFLPHLIVQRMGNKRVFKFLTLFPEAIDTICRGLRSGLPVTESMATVGHELPDPVGIEFKRISDSVRVGRTLEDSMWEVAKRLDVPEYRFFIIALAIQKETGGNLAETMDNLGELLRKRRQLRLKIKAMSSEAKASAMIIGSLPFLMFSLLMVVNPDYIMTLFHDDRGKVMLAFAGSMIAMGVFVMKNMINFEL